MNGHQQLLDLAVAAAQRGAAHVRSATPPAEPEGWGLKGTADYVTAVDRDAEQLIADVLLSGEPNSVVLGEELTPDAARGGLYWVVDPLDGTTNYLHRYPAYGVSVAAVVDGEPVAGAVVDVPRDRTYRALRDGGAWEGDRRLAVSRVADPAHALLGTGFPFKVPNLVPDYLRQLETLLHSTAGVRRAGAASLDLVDVALGRFDGFWELYLAPWDVAAGALLVREAGGRITDPDGDENVVRHGAFVAGNPVIHAWLLQVLREG